MNINFNMLNNFQRTREGKRESNLLSAGSPYKSKINPHSGAQLFESLEVMRLAMMRLSADLVS
jgi:hypothetical protein